MDKATLLALIDALIENKFSDIEKPSAERGKRGLKGRPGNDFSFEDNKEKIQEILNNVFESSKDSLKLKLEDLTKEELDSLKLKFIDLSQEEKVSLKGQRGPKGQKAKDFSFPEHSGDIASLILENKDSLSVQGDAGERGPRGQRGKPGQSFSFSEEQEKIVDILAQLFTDQKTDLKLNFSDLTEEETDSLKLKFQDLTLENKEDLQGLPGERGPRGQRGKGFKFSENEENIKEVISDERDNLKLKFSDLTSKEKETIKGRQGLPGLDGKAGLQGLPGSQGFSGLDAAEIVSVEIETVGETFCLVFYFSDGTAIETNKIDLPSAEKIIQNFYSSGGGGGGGGTADPLEVLKDDVLVGASEQLNFEGDNISVAWDDINKKSTVTVDQFELEVLDDGTTVGLAEKIDFDTGLDVTWDDLTKTATVTSTGGTSTCIPVMDEGVEVTACVKDFNFIGDGVEVWVQTTMGDWVLLSDVDPLSEEYTDTGHVQVRVPSPSKFALTKIASTDISAYDLIRLDSMTTATKANVSSYTDAKVIGVAIDDASTGNDFRILLLGIIEDPAFTFPINEPLFLQSDGTWGLTPTSTTGEYRTNVGYSLGTGAIMIKVEEPIGIA